MHSALHQDGGEAEFSDEIVTALAERLQDPERGLTARSRRFSRLEVMGAIAENLPDGLEDVEQLDRLTDQVLADARFVDLQLSAKNERGINHHHLKNAELMTTADVIAAEKTIFARASVRGESYARVEDEVALNAISVAEAGQGFELTDDQQTAVMATVTSGQAVDAILGPPASGISIIINNPLRLLWSVTWPWAPTPGSATGPKRTTSNWPTSRSSDPG